MNERSFWPKLFLVAAVWNYGAGIMLLFHRPVNALLGMKAVEDIAYLQMMSGVVLIFGIGYHLVSLDVTKNHGIIFLGILGKIFIFILVTYYWIEGYFHLVNFLTGTGDLLFSLFFIDFLRRERRHREDGTRRLSDYP